MIILTDEQGSAAWVESRLGTCTSSRFDSIIQPSTGKLSKSCTKYACQLIAEEILGYPVDDAASSPFMIRGTKLEADAVAWYELTTDCDTTKCGLILRDDKRVGCSPDRLVGAPGGLEIKVPNVVNHLAFLLGDAEVAQKYRPQVQGCLLITEREWWDTLSYNPQLGNVIVRAYRDEPYIKLLDAALSQFLEHVAELKDKLVRAGHFPDLAVPALKLA